MLCYALLGWVRLGFGNAWQARFVLFSWDKLRLCELSCVLGVAGKVR